MVHLSMPRTCEPRDDDVLPIFTRFTSLGFMLLLLTACTSTLTPGSEPPPPALRDFDRAITDLADWWFPRVVDDADGGFFEAYDDAYHPINSRQIHEPGESTRTLVFQSRITWVAATLAEALPDRAPRMRPCVDHGLTYLRQHMADPRNGGMFWARTIDGQPTARFADEKHAYGISFAIFAAAKAGRVFPDSDGLPMAKQLFTWLDQNAHDEKFGGYIESLDFKNKFDALGTLVGYKSMNTHIHLLEAFTELYHLWPDPHLKARLAELDDIVRHRIFVAPGCLNMFFTRDWRAVPDADSFGHDIETAYLLTESGRALGLPDSDTLAEPRMLIDHALAYGWDEEHGGLFDAGSTFRRAPASAKIWWVQAESLHALALAHSLWPDQPIYAQRYAQQWRFISDHVIDPTDGGWHAATDPAGKPLDDSRKVHHWKAGYHTLRALVQCRALAAKTQGEHMMRAAGEQVHPWTALPDENDHQTFRFAVVSDNSGGARPGVFADAMRKLKLMHPDFVMSVGDFIEGYGANDVELRQQWQQIDDAMLRLGDVPFFYVPGNHDIAHPVQRRVWNERFGRSYYSFIYRGVLMLCLDAQEHFPEGLEQDQIDYALKVLAEHADVRWTFVFMHKPLWWHDKTGWAQIEKVLNDRPHTVFTGHIHNYHHESRNEHDYFVLSVTGGDNQLRGVEKGDFDHIMWVTMTANGPRYANVLLDGIYDKNLSQSKSAVLYQALDAPQTVMIEPLYQSPDHAAPQTIHMLVQNPTQAAMYVSLRVDAAILETTIPPGQRQRVDAPATITDVAAWKTPLKLQYETGFRGVDPSGLPVRRPASTAMILPQPQRPIPRCAEPVRVDGQLDEWAQLPYQSSAPSSDGSFAFGLSCDDANLYIGIEVTDNQLIGKSNDQPWSQDGVEVRIDARPDPVRSNGRGSNDASFSQYLLLGVALGDDPTKPGINYAAKRQPAGIVTALHRTTDGYAVELAIAHKVLNDFAGGDWNALRLNLTVDDRDENTSPRQTWWQPDWRSGDNQIASGTFARTSSSNASPQTPAQ